MFPVSMCLLIFLNLKVVDKAWTDSMIEANVFRKRHICSVVHFFKTIWYWYLRHVQKSQFWYVLRTRKHWNLMQPQSNVVADLFCDRSVRIRVSCIKQTNDLWVHRIGYWSLNENHSILSQIYYLTNFIFVLSYRLQDLRKKTLQTILIFAWSKDFCSNKCAFINQGKLKTIELDLEGSEIKWRFFCLMST